MLCDGGIVGGSSTPSCFTAASKLERIHVSAAVCSIQPGDSLEDAGSFPALAWLPEMLQKDDLVVRRLAVPQNGLH